MHLGAPLIAQTIDGLVEGTVVVKNRIKILIQNLPKLNNENTRIDWTQKGSHIENLIKGLSPYPAAWTHFVEDDQTFRLKIYKTFFLDEKHQLRAGQFKIEDQKIKIAVHDGYVVVEELQFPNKKKE